MNLVNILEVDICNPNTGLLSVFTVIGNIISFIKIAVPIILILMGSIDLTKAVMASKDDEIKKAQSTLIKRAIVGVVIFFLPTLISMIMSLVNQNTDTQCFNCIVDPNGGACKESMNKLK